MIIAFIIYTIVKIFCDWKRKPTNNNNYNKSGSSSVQMDNIKMDTNPCYDTNPTGTDTIKMDTNPCYDTAAKCV